MNDYIDVKCVGQFDIKIIIDIIMEMFNANGSKSNEIQSKQTFLNTHGSKSNGIQSKQTFLMNEIKLDYETKLVATNVAMKIFEWKFKEISLNVLTNVYQYFL